MEREDSSDDSVDDFEIAGNNDSDLSDNDISSLQAKLSDVIVEESQEKHETIEITEEKKEIEVKYENLSLKPKEVIKSPREIISPRRQAPESSLKIHSRRNELKNSRNPLENHIEINLDSLSAIALADIKRFSLSSTSILEVEGIIYKIIQAIINKRTKR